MMEERGSVLIHLNISSNRKLFICIISPTATDRFLSNLVSFIGNELMKRDDDQSDLNLAGMYCHGIFFHRSLYLSPRYI